MTQIIEKNLAGLEDLEIGSGSVVQNRAGQAVTINKIDAEWIQATIVGIKGLDVSMIKHIALIDTNNNSQIFDYFASSTLDNNDIDVLEPDTGTGRWLLRRVNDFQQQETADGTNGISTTPHNNLVPGTIIKALYADDGAVVGSGDEFHHSGVTDSSKAADWPNADGYYYDSIGKQFTRFIKYWNGVGGGPGNGGVFFNSLQDLINDPFVIRGNIVETAGYGVRGDYGNMRYLIESPEVGTPDAGSVVTLTGSSLIAIALFPDGIINAEHFGVGSGIINDQDAAAAAFTYAAGERVNFYNSVDLSGILPPDPNAPPSLIDFAWINYDETTIEETAGILTKWANRGIGGSALDLDQVDILGAAPAIIEVNGLPAIRSLEDTYLASDEVTSVDSYPITQFFVIQFDNPVPGEDQQLGHGRTSSASNISYVYTDNSNDNKWTMAQGPTPIALSEPYDNDLHVITAHFNDDNTSSLEVSGVGSVQGDAGSKHINFASFLNYPSSIVERGLIGKVCQIMVYDSQLTSENSETVQNYLAAKWGAVT